MEIELTKGYRAIVDAADFERLDPFIWHVLDGHPIHRYAARWISGAKPRKVMRMHHQVLNVDVGWLVSKNLVVDHINRNGLDNRKENLRIATRRQNILNSGHCDNARGIYWDDYRGRFKAVIVPDGKFIGWFKTLEEAESAKWPSSTSTSA